MEFDGGRKDIECRNLASTNIAQYNMSFLSATDYAALFQQMFPNSSIVASYKQFYAKVSYLEIQYSRSSEETAYI